MDSKPVIVGKTEEVKGILRVARDLFGVRIAVKDTNKTVFGGKDSQVVDWEVVGTPEGNELDLLKQRYILAGQKKREEDPLLRGFYSE